MLFPSNEKDGTNWLVSPNLENVCRVGSGRIQAYEQGGRKVPDGLWPIFLSDRGQLFFNRPRGLTVASLNGGLEEITWPENFTVNKIQFRDDGSELVVESLDAGGGSSLWKLSQGRLTPVLSLPKGAPFLWQASASLQWLAGYRRGTTELVVWRTDSRNQLEQLVLASPLLQFWVGEGDHLLLQNGHGNWEWRTFDGSLLGPVLLSSEAAVRGGSRPGVLFYQADAAGGGGYYRLDLRESPRLVNCALHGLEGLVLLRPPAQARCYRGDHTWELSLLDEAPASLQRLLDLASEGELRLSAYFQPMARVSQGWLPVGQQRLSSQGLAQIVGQVLTPGASAAQLKVGEKSYRVQVEPLPRFGYLFQPCPEAGEALDDPSFRLDDLLRVVMKHGGRELLLQNDDFPKTELAECGWISVGNWRLTEQAIARLMKDFEGQVEGISFEIVNQQGGYRLRRI